jgi:hypothetical protein
MRNFTICLDDETHSRLSAAASSCGVTRGHVAREVLRASFGVHPLRGVFAAPTPNRDAPWVNWDGQGVPWQDRNGQAIDGA